MCEDCEDALVLRGFRFYIDEQLTERVANILLDKGSSEDLESLIKDLKDRLDGKCFCSAYSSNECLCGAWD